MERSREQLQGTLELAATQSRTSAIVSADDFMALVKNRWLAGPQELSKDAEAIIQVYVAANLAGGEKLTDHITRVFRFIPESEFEKPIHPGTDITLGNAIHLARFAIAKWPAVGKDKNPITSLPLAV